MDHFEKKALLVQFENALNIASEAKLRYQEKPIVRSRGVAPYPSPWFKIGNESTQTVIRLARLLKSLAFPSGPWTRN